MNIISQIIESVTKNFYKSINEYNLDKLFSYGVVKDFNHYINMVRCIDTVSSNFSIEMYRSFLNSIDEAFFNSSYRKQFCKSINIPKRDLYTFYGNVTFNRRYYYDKLKKKKFFFVDEVLLLPKYCRFDPFVCAKVCEVSSHESYAKAGRTVSEMIGNRLKFYDDPNRYIINRATARKMVLNFNIPDIPYSLKDDVSILYVMLDEHFVYSQFNNGVDHMVKAAVVFEDAELVYKYKKKDGSVDRFQLIGKHVLASIDNDLKKQVMDYIYYSYNTDKMKEIVFMGDCASWITSFPADFKFHSDLKITFSIDGYHYAQALEHITTIKYEDWLPFFKDYIKADSKPDFIALCDSLIELEPSRIETITEKKNYILNNWKYIQNYYHHVNMKCSMESNISHCFADIFTSRPRAYSYEGLKQLLKLRLLKVNNHDIQKIYFDVLNNKYTYNPILNFEVFSSNSKSDYFSIPTQINKKLTFRLNA